MATMRESMTRSQDLFKQVWDHFEDLRSKGFPGSEWYTSEMRGVSLPGGIRTTETLERDKNGERGKRVCEMDGKKVSESYTRDAEGKEERNRQLDGVAEGDVDAFFNDFRQRYAAAGGKEASKRLT